MRNFPLALADRAWVAEQQASLEKGLVSSEELPLRVYCEKKPFSHYSAVDFPLVRYVAEYDRSKDRNGAKLPYG